MDKWECPCGYIYDQKEGDYENDVDQGTKWEDVPSDWACPKCGAEKEDFWKTDQTDKKTLSDKNTCAIFMMVAGIFVSGSDSRTLCYTWFFNG